MLRHKLLEKSRASNVNEACKSCHFDVCSSWYSASVCFINLTHRTTPEIHEAHTLFVHDNWHLGWKGSWKTLLDKNYFYKKVFGNAILCVHTVTLLTDMISRMNMRSALTGFWSVLLINVLCSQMIFRWHLWISQFNHMTISSDHFIDFNKYSIQLCFSKYADAYHFRADGKNIGLSNFQIFHLG